MRKKYFALLYIFHESPTFNECIQSQYKYTLSFYISSLALDNLYYDYEDYYSACAEGGKKNKTSWQLNKFITL